MSDLVAVVLAAGQGKRMKSSRSKVLFPVAGRPLVFYPVAAALAAGARHVVCVVSPDNRDEVLSALNECFGEERVSAKVQDPPQGTGDAARVGLDGLEGERVLVLCGDTPLLETAALSKLVAALDEHGAELALASCELDDPTGYGRVLRGANGRVLEVREDRDLASEEQRRVREINAGVYAAEAAFLKGALLQLRPDNAQGEYYLTDVVSIAARQHKAIAVLGDPAALLGVNDRTQLAEAEELLFARNADAHGRAGASVKRGARIDTGVLVEPDAVIEAGAVLRGKCVVKSGATVDVGAVVTNSEIGPGALIKPYSVITDSRVGPFAHLRPGSEIDEDAHIGNFVETKKTRVRKGAKANHLAYLGDGDIGEGANVGAGTIFCNYDGFKKHKTVIGPGAFIGSDSQIVAPVTIGEGAYVATGTTVTKDVPADALAIARVKQENKLGYASRLRARLKNS
jgi:bifunctional UDP-N-acetylglucosamine pyrophosphorylase/glucosamine-1-phosphate N-acetyltransferase